MLCIKVASALELRRVILKCVFFLYLYEKIMLHTIYTYYNLPILTEVNPENLCRVFACMGRGEDIFRLIAVDG